ncbi:MAG: FUN14 domain-containing protein [bacterium]
MEVSVADFFSSIVQKIRDFWNDFDLEKWAEKVGGTSGEAVQAAVYFGLFFAVGFLFKKYFKFFFACIIVAIIVLKVMEYNGLITIDMVAIKKLVGITAESDFNSLINSSFDWIKSHLILFVSSSVGFLVGYMLG